MYRDMSLEYTPVELLEDSWTGGRIYLSEPLEKIGELQKLPIPVESQQGISFIKKNLTWINKM